MGFLQMICVNRLFTHLFHSNDEVIKSSEFFFGITIVNHTFLSESWFSSNNSASIYVVVSSKDIVNSVNKKEKLDNKEHFFLKNVCLIGYVRPAWTLSTYASERNAERTIFSHVMPA